MSPQVNPHEPSELALLEQAALTVSKVGESAVDIAEIAELVAVSEQTARELSPRMKTCCQPFVSSSIRDSKPTSTKNYGSCRMRLLRWKSWLRWHMGTSISAKQKNITLVPLLL